MSCIPGYCECCRDFLVLQFCVPSSTDASASGANSGALPASKRKPKKTPVADPGPISEEKVALLVRDAINDCRRNGAGTSVSRRFIHSLP